AAAPLDAVSHRIAFRTAGVVEEPDEVRTSFTVVVNDRPVLVKGANWIPDDYFPTRLTAEDYARGVGHVVDAGMNMLRIWVGLRGGRTRGNGGRAIEDVAGCSGGCCEDGGEEGGGWANRYYTAIFPAIASALDPTRSYAPSSPYSRGVPEQPRLPVHGTAHN